MGIILLGFKLNPAVLLSGGLRTAAVITVYAAVSLSLSFILGKIFNIDNKTALLIGAGSSICGASAVAALTPCLNADRQKSVIAVTVVNLLGAAGVIIYSVIAVKSNNLNEYNYGLWSGLTLHGVAHALAAAFAMGDISGEAGTVIKMSRVLLIIPVSVLFTLISGKHSDKSYKISDLIPWYVFIFSAAALINSFTVLPDFFLEITTKASSLFILAAMTGLGFSVKLQTAAGEGLRALSTGAVLFLILSVSGYYAVQYLF